MSAALAFLRTHWKVGAGVAGVVVILVVANVLRPPSFQDVQSSHSVYATTETFVEHYHTDVEIRYRDRVVEVKKFDPVTGHLTYEATTTDKGGSTSGSTDATRSVTRTESSEATTSRVVTSTEGRWRVTAGAGLGSSGAFLGSLGVGYRLVGPLEIGALATFPVSGPGQFQGLLTLGLRL